MANQDLDLKLLEKEDHCASLLRLIQATWPAIIKGCELPLILSLNGIVMQVTMQVICQLILYT